MIKKVLVIRFRRIGDSVLSLSICSTLRKNFPEAQIHYVLNESIGTLFEGHPDVDRVISFSNEECHRKMLFCKKVFQLMRKERYDVIVDTRSTLMTLCFALCSLRSRYRIGTWKWYSLFLHNFRVKNQQESQLDEVQRNLLLVSPLMRLRPMTYVSDFRLVLPKEEIREFKEKMQKEGIDFSKPIIVCAPCTRVNGKAWNREYMKEILWRILKHYPAQLIFNYDKTEKEDVYQLYQEMNQHPRIFVHVEADSLRRLVAMLSLSTFFFGNEGGPRHMAQACGVPSFAIYPPQVNKQKWLPAPSQCNQGISPYDVISQSEREYLMGQVCFDRLNADRVWEKLSPMLDLFLRVKL